jgi:hypothetical protein
MYREIELCQLSANEHIKLFKFESDRALVARKLRSRFEDVAAAVGQVTSEREAR